MTGGRSDREVVWKVRQCRQEGVVRWSSCRCGEEAAIVKPELWWSSCMMMRKCRKLAVASRKSCFAETMGYYRRFGGGLGFGLGVLVIR